MIPDWINKTSYRTIKFSLFSLKELFFLISLLFSLKMKKSRRLGGIFVYLNVINDFSLNTSRKELMIPYFLAVTPLKIHNIHLLPIPFRSFHFKINFLPFVPFKSKNSQSLSSIPDDTRFSSHSLHPVSFTSHPCWRFVKKKCESCRIIVKVVQNRRKPNEFSWKSSENKSFFSIRSLQVCLKFDSFSSTPSAKMRILLDTKFPPMSLHSN